MRIFFYMAKFFFCLICSVQLWAATCGGKGQRACTVFERIPSCDAYLVESAGKCIHPDCGREGERACAVTKRIPSCDKNLVEKRGTCVKQTPCGAEDQRPCLVSERIPSCDKNLIESGGKCVHPPCGQEGKRPCTVAQRIPSCDNDLIEFNDKCISEVPCGAENQRACLVTERVPSCDSYLVEKSKKCVHPDCGRLNENACTVFVRNIACDTNLIEVEGKCQKSVACGSEKLRPCRVSERIPSCDTYLVESKGKCVHPNCGRFNDKPCTVLQRIPSCDAGLVESGGLCVVSTPCGSENQRACLISERVPSCDANLLEQQGRCVHPNCGKINQKACKVWQRFPSCDNGLTELRGVCVDSTACGSENQRACLMTERFPSCNRDLIESKGKCVHPDCGKLGEKACAITVRISSCDRDLVEVQGRCSDICGKEGQRACFISERIPSCNTNLVESKGECVRPSCGAAGQRSCKNAERLRSCDVGLAEIPGCTGECYGSTSMCADLKAKVVEPGTNSTPTNAKSQNPLYGYADLHVHMFAHLTFGGGVFIGAPYANGGIAEALKPDYATDLDLVSPLGTELARAKCPATIPNCGKVILHGDHTIPDDTAGFGTDDGTDSNFGYPLFNGWPTWRTTTHQQVYYKWLERAYRGGLRVMTMLAVSNEILCKTSKHLRNYDCNNSMLGVDAQLQAAIDFEKWLDNQPGGGWFKIVYDADQAAEVIKQGKLAVILGIESDTLFNCRWNNKCTAEFVNSEVEKYYRMGVRYIFPTHDFDGGFAGTAVWMDVLNAGNRIIEKEWYDVEPCNTTDFVLDTNALGSIISRIATAGTNIIEMTKIKYPKYTEKPSCNKKGLTNLGNVLVTKAMDKGILIDIDHMSAKAVGHTIEMAKKRGGYPLFSGHSLFSEMHKAENKRHERMRTPQQIAELKKLGGLISVMTQDELEDERDCKHSSRSFAKNYEYLVSKLDGSQVAAIPFGSDFNGLAQHVGPRYGDDACGGNQIQADSELGKKRLKYPFIIKGFGEFDKQVTGQRTFDFNSDGLAHIGLYPDLIADLSLAGVDLEPLMRSAEGYIKSWKKAESFKK